MRNESRFERLNTPLNRALSLIVTLAMVLSLMPAQGVAWAVEEATAQPTEGAVVEDTGGEVATVPDAEPADTENVGGATGDVSVGSNENEEIAGQTQSITKAELASTQVPAQQLAEEQLSTDKKENSVDASDVDMIVSAGQQEPKLQYDKSDGIVHSDRQGAAEQPQISQKKINALKSNATPAGSNMNLLGEGNGGEKDLFNFVSTAEITGVQSGGTVLPDTKYDVKLSFVEEGSNHQFSDTEEMMYVFPDGFVPEERTGQVLDILVKGDKSANPPTDDVTVYGNPWRIVKSTEGGKAVYRLYVKWNTGDSNYARLIASKSTTFFVSFNGQFDGTAKIVNFGGANNTYPVNTEHSVSVTKQASFRGQNYAIDGKGHYTVTVSATGKNNNVQVHDALNTGNIQTIDVDSIVLTSNKRSISPNDYTQTSIANDSFDYTINQMSDEEVITITYATNIDYTQLGQGGKGTAQNTGNTVTVKSNEDTSEESASSNLANQIDGYLTSSKTGVETTTGSEAVNHKTILWTVKVNNNPIVSVGRKKITDSIGESSKSMMSYSGEGITIQRQNKNGENVDGPVKVTWASVGVTDGQKSYEYTLPNDTEPYCYVITYQTDVDFTGKSSPSYTLANSVSGEVPGANGSVVLVNPNTDSAVNLKKRVVSTDPTTNDITWEISFDVPKEGLNGPVQLTDVLPDQWFDGEGRIYEDIKDGESGVTVSGLIEGKESWDYTEQLSGTNGSDHTFTLTFSNNNEENNGGLIKSESKRTVTVRFTTKSDAYWVQHNVEHPGDYHTHKNTAVLKANGDDTNAFAEKVFTQIGLTKSADGNGTVDVSGIDLPYFKYKIVLSNISEDDFVNDNLTIKDSFNTEILEPYDLNQWDSWFYSQGEYLINDTKKSINYSTTSDGIEFKIASSDIQRNNGKLNDKYVLTYCLKVKDPAALTSLKSLAAASDGAVAELKNTASFGDVHAEATSTYKYVAGGKEIIGNKDDQVNKPTFRLTINPEAQDLNPSGDTVTVTDSIENLSLYYDTVVIKDGDTILSNIKWDTKGNDVTFEIPDEKKITIEYSAQIIKSGVKYSNTLTVKGQHFTKEDTVSFDQTSGGEAESTKIRLKKYRGGFQESTLAGAVFELHDANHDPIVNKKTNQPVTFTSGSDGIVSVVDGATGEYDLIRGTQYYLKETTAPAGYKALDYEVGFMITNAAHPVDYEPADGQSYVYFNNDIMTAKNYNATVPVRKVWVGDEEGATHAPITVRLEQKLPTGDWSSNIVTPSPSEVNGWEHTSTTEKTLTLSGANGWEGTFDDLPAVYNVEGVTNPQEIEYRVVEVNTPEGYGSVVTGDDAKGFVITNTKGQIQGKSAPSVWKMVTGNTTSGTYDVTVQDEEFEFTLAKAIGSPRTKESDVLPGNTTVKLKTNDNGAVAAAKFDDITFSEAGTYLYTIKETAGSTSGMSYDTAAHYAKAVVTENADQTALEVAWTYGDSADACTSSTLEITNKFSKVTFTPSVEKVVEGTNAPTNETYTFVIAKGAGSERPTSDVLPTDATAITTGSGTATFGAITFTEPGNYTYTVTETAPTNKTPGMTYSNATVNIAVTVSQAENGELTVGTPSVTGGNKDGKFVNSYTQPSTTATPAVKKAVTGYTGNDGFVFTLDPISAIINGVAVEAAEVPMPTTEGGNKATVKANDTTASNFGTIVYTQAGTYWYKITETQGAIPGMSYNSTPQYVMVTVTADVNGNLSSDVKYGDAKSADACTSSTLTITNTYEAPTPAIEKYVDKDVHSDLTAFDTKFTYDILAFVTTDADKVEIVDALESEVQFANGSSTAVSVADMGASNNHNAGGGGTVSYTGMAIAEATSSISGQTLTVTIPEDGVASLRGHWVRVTFEAKLNNAAGNVSTWAEYTSKKQAISENKPVQTSVTSHEGIKNQASYKVYVKSGEAVPDKPTYEKFSNTVTVTPGTTSVYVEKAWQDENGTALSAWPSGVSSVTVKLMKQKGIEAKTEVETTELKSDKQNHTFTNLPKYEGVTYSVEEVAVTGYTGTTAAKTVTGVDVGYTITNKKKVPGTASISISGTKELQGAALAAEQFSFRLEEKGAGDAWTQVGQTTTNDAAGKFKFDLSYDAAGNHTYRVTEVIPGDADKTIVYDPSVYTVTVSVTKSGDALSAEIADVKKGGAPVSDKAITFSNETANPEIEKYVNKDVHSDLAYFDTTFTYDIMAYVPKDADYVVIEDTLVGGIQFANGANTTVAVADMGTTNDHVAQTGTVASDGTALDAATKTSSTIEGQKLTVVIANAASLRGHWVKVTYGAKLNNSVVGDWSQYEIAITSITTNAPVVTSKGSHEGVSNTASYKVYVKGQGMAGDAPTEGEQPKYTDGSNTVTVTPGTTSVYVEKAWQEADGSAASWPNGATVTVTLMKKEGANAAQATDQTLQLTSTSASGSFSNLPVYENVTYSVAESSVAGVSSDEYATTIAGDATNGYTITNKKKAPGAASASISGKKELQGADLAAGQFSFRLEEKGAGDAWTQVGQTAANDAAGKFKFDLSYDAEGTHTYRVTEVISGDADETLVYDRSVYTVVVSVTKTGGNLNAAITDVKKGENSLSASGTIAFTNNKTLVKISKVEVSKSEEIPGAHIQIIRKSTDGKETVVQEWTSTNEPAEIKGLETGVEYILRETVSPTGYAIATDTTFTIGEDGAVTTTATKSSDGTLLVEDTKSLYLNKVDATNQQELAGATIQIIDKQTSKVVDEWLSNKNETHEIRNVQVGKEYILRETVAPEGYTVASDTTFKLNKDGSVTKDGPAVSKTEDGKNVLLVEDAKTSVKISKVEVGAGEELAGAHIQILDKDGKVVEQWDSTNQAHTVTGLKTEETYTLRETVAPDGYAVTTDTTVYLKKDGSIDKDKTTTTVSDRGVLLVEDAKTSVKISKVEVGAGEELAGAHIQIIDKATGEVVKLDGQPVEWVSVADDASTADVNEAIHEVEGLKTGVEYILRETVAPDGYAVTTDTTFYLKKDGSIDKDKTTTTVSDQGVLLVEDAKTKVKISKVDVTDGDKELPGAKLQILDKNGQVVEIDGEKLEWVSTDKPKEIEGLKAGVTYTLHEEVAPDGYMFATDTTFTLKADGTVDTDNTKTTASVKDGVLLVEDKAAEPALEKYINKDVHQDLPAFDTPFTYDILAYVPKDADRVVIKDPLAKGIRFLNGRNTKVVVQEIGPSNDHTAHGTVEQAEGRDIEYAAEVDDANKLLTVRVPDAQRQALRGKWLRVTYQVALDNDVVGNRSDYEDEDIDLDVTTNKTVKSEDYPTHDGVLTSASYVVFADGDADDNPKYSLEANDITVTPPTETVKVDKAWKDADGNAAAWPEGAKVTIALQVNGKQVDDELATTLGIAERSLELTAANPSGEFGELPVYDAYDYSVAETSVTGVDKGFVATVSGNAKDGFVVTNATTKVSISKVDVAGGAELEGAHIQILDKDGNVVEEWDSTKEAHVVEGLKPGVAYTLRETVAPLGYAIATDTTFTLKADGTVDKSQSTVSVSDDGTLLVEDAAIAVYVSKVDIADGKEISGAKLQVLDANGQVVDEWTSKEGENHLIKGLVAGQTYTLRETVAPDGYNVTTDIEFTVNADGTITTKGKTTKDANGNTVLLVEDAKKTTTKTTAKTTAPSSSTSTKTSASGKSLAKTSDALLGAAVPYLATLGSTLTLAGTLHKRRRRK